MNQVQLIGRITRDIQLSYSQSNTAVCQMNIAINRGKDKNGNDLGADFPRVVVFGKQAENCQRYLAKGSMVAIEGRIQTGSYDRNGEKVYTTDVIANRVEFIDFANKNAQNENQGVTGAYGQQGYGQPQQQGYQQPQQQSFGQQNYGQQEFHGFQPVNDEDIPFDGNTERW